MIELYTGMPGSGKTFACTYRAMKAIKSGDKVFTNYPVKGAYQVKYDDLIDYKFPAGSTVIIDEAGRWFNTRKWKDLPPECFDLFTLHRHFRLNLIVAVQNFNRVDVALREVAELTWWSHNHPLLPFFIYEGYFDVEKMGMKGEHNKLSLIWKWSRSRKYYDTHAMERIMEDKGEIPLIPWTEERVKPFWAMLWDKLRRRQPPEGAYAAGKASAGGRTEE